MLEQKQKHATDNRFIRKKIIILCNHWQLLTLLSKLNIVESIWYSFVCKTLAPSPPRFDHIAQHTLLRYIERTKNGQWLRLVHFTISTRKLGKIATSHVKLVCIRFTCTKSINCFKNSISKIGYTIAGCQFDGFDICTTSSFDCNSFIFHNGFPSTNHKSRFFFVSQALHLLLVIGCVKAKSFF